MCLLLAGNELAHTVNVELFIVIMINMEVEVIVAHMTRKMLRKHSHSVSEVVHWQTGNTVLL